MCNMAMISILELSHHHYKLHYAYTMQFEILLANQSLLSTDDI